MLACPYPCDNDQLSRVSNSKQYFDELNIERFDFTNGVKSSDMHRFEKVKNLSIKINEIYFYQEGDKRKIILLPIEIKKISQIKFLTH